jgi:hypothetical protein
MMVFRTSRIGLRFVVKSLARLLAIRSLLLLLAVLLVGLPQAQAATYYYQAAGNPNNPGDWDTNITGGGANAPNFTTNGDIFIIPTGRNAGLNNNLVLGAGANAVTLIVQNGARLGTNIYAVQFAGNGSTFNLLAGGTLQTSNSQGINGADNLTGAIQITAGAPASVNIIYDNAANYIFGNVSVASFTRFQDLSGNKQAITQAANITVLTMSPGGEWWCDAGVTLSGDLIVQNSANIQLFGTLTLTNAGSLIQNGGTLLFNGNGRLANGAFLTVQSGGSVTIYNPLLPAIVTGSAINYNAGGTLQYLTTSSAVLIALFVHNTL